MNLAGSLTYYVYPAAPPWYAQQYGFGPVHYDARANIAGAARFDELLGIPYFAVLYSRSADVFGAIPSLHVAYPLLAFLFGRELRLWWLDAATGVLFLLVCFGAVYFQHHYVVDVLVGAAYALAAYGASCFWKTRKRL
jgi:membrane-associated phospholipid phosphatase